MEQQKSLPDYEGDLYDIRFLYEGSVSKNSIDHKYEAQNDFYPGTRL